MKKLSVRFLENKLQIMVVFAVIVFVAVVYFLIFMNPKKQQVNQPVGSKGSYLVDLKTTVSNTDVYLKDVISGTESKYFSLPDIYVEHYHAAEYSNGSIYLIRRPGGSESYITNPNWSDELWKYNLKGTGVKIFSKKGIDFRISDKTNQIAIFTHDENSLITLTDLNGNIQKVFSEKDLSILKSDDILRPFYWLNGNLWFTANQGRRVESIYALDGMRSDDLKIFDVSDLQISPGELAINPSGETIAYSDYISALDSSEQGEKNASLFVYNLQTKENVMLISDMTASAFTPRWINETTLEYSDPMSKVRKVITIE